MPNSDSVWDALKAHSKSKFDADRATFLAQAESLDDGGWTKHTMYHWSRLLNGKRLDYWPSRKKWQCNGKVQLGNVQAFMATQKDTPKDLEMAPEEIATIQPLREQGYAAVLLNPEELVGAPAHASDPLPWEPDWEAIDYLTDDEKRNTGDKHG